MSRADVKEENGSPVVLVLCVNMGKFREEGRVEPRVKQRDIKIAMWL
jgi:hypothetical protein